MKKFSALLVLVGLLGGTPAFAGDSYSNYGALASNTVFLQRLDFALHKAAQSIVAESVSVTSHAQRRNFAQNVIFGNYNVAGAALYVLADATIQGLASVGVNGGNITDAQLDAAIAAAWNALAGV